MLSQMRYILRNKPCESPVHILAAIMIIVGDTKSIGYIGRNGTASVNKDQTTPANPKMNSPPYLSLKYPPTTCAGMYPQKNADMIAPWNNQKQTIWFTFFHWLQWGIFRYSRKQKHTVIILTNTKKEHSAKHAYF